MILYQACLTRIRKYYKKNQNSSKNKQNHIQVLRDIGCDSKIILIDTKDVESCEKFRKNERTYNHLSLIFWVIKSKLKRTFLLMR